MSSQTVCMGRCKVAKVALMWFFSIVSFRMCPQMDRLTGSIRTTAIKGNNSLFRIIPYLVWFEWLIFIIFSWQLLVSLHTLHLCDFSLVLIFKCTRRRDAWTEVWSQKLHLCGFLQCEFSNVPSDSLLKQRNSHIGCTCVIFLLSEFSNVLAYCLRQLLRNHIGCRWLPSLFSCLSHYC